MVSDTAMLNDARIKAAKPKLKPYRLSDAGQLYLQVTPSGGRHWRMNYAFGKNASGKPAQKTLSFGSYPIVTLLQARARRDEAKRLLASGMDPSVARKSEEAAAQAHHRNSFGAIANEWFEMNSGWSVSKLRSWIGENLGKWSVSDCEKWTIKAHARWSNVHSADVFISMDRDVLPFIGHRPVQELTAREILELLRSIEQRGAIETAHRMRQRISAVFLYGVALGACLNDPAASLGKLLTKVPASKPQPSIIDESFNQQSRIRAIRQVLIDCESQRCRASTKLAMRIVALTAVRPNELAGARWTELVELDGDTPTWTIPAARMKGTQDRKSNPRNDHHVPLAVQTVEAFRALRLLTGSFDLCFPSERHVHRPISENTLRALLIRAGYYQRHVPHGFRAAFSTYMNERPLMERQEGDRSVIDLMLAHVPDAGIRADEPGVRVSASEAAYNRALYMPRRRELAQEWADALLADFWPAETLLGGPIRWAANGPGPSR
jgi:integrase